MSFIGFEFGLGGRVAGPGPAGTVDLISILLSQSRRDADVLLAMEAMVLEYMAVYILFGPWHHGRQKTV